MNRQADAYPAGSGEYRAFLSGRHGRHIHVLANDSLIGTPACLHVCRHFASSDPSTALPPMGMRVRLKASYNITGFPANVQVRPSQVRNLRT